MALLDRLKVAQVKEIINKFVLRKEDSKRILSGKISAPILLKKLSSKGPLKPSQIYKILKPLSYEVILFALAKGTNLQLKQRVRRFFVGYEDVRIKTSGEDLKKLGFKPGPHFKNILRKLQYMKVDGQLKSKKDELKLIQKLTCRYK